ncbi:hypothetical protein VNO78_21784 [Psophocarpus tetragonolobus]|uniref:Uncharacterized protein n=1 Tax=Psophocarpus tetragonolobus TaxID=3891 RepID=A0AAN9XIC5_PSOTE
MFQSLDEKALLAIPLESNILYSSLCDKLQLGHWTALISVFMFPTFQSLHEKGLIGYVSGESNILHASLSCL